MEQPTNGMSFLTLPKAEETGTTNRCCRPPNWIHHQQCTVRKVGSILLTPASLPGQTKTTRET